MITDDKRQAEYIQSVREDRELNQRRMSSQTNWTWCAIPSSTCSRRNASRTRSRIARRARPIARPSRVYLIYDATDEEQVEPLEDYLFDQGLEVMVPEFEGGEEHITKVHRDKLARCDAALIYFGKGTRAWVETKLMDLCRRPVTAARSGWQVGLRRPTGGSPEKTIQDPLRGTHPG